MKQEDRLMEMKSYIDGERKIVEHKEKNRAAQEAIKLQDKEWVEEIDRLFVVIESADISSRDKTLEQFILTLLKSKMGIEDELA